MLVFYSYVSLPEGMCFVGCFLKLSHFQWEFSEFRRERDVWQHVSILDSVLEWWLDMFLKDTSLMRWFKLYMEAKSCWNAAEHGQLVCLLTGHKVVNGNTVEFWQAKYLSIFYNRQN